MADEFEKLFGWIPPFERTPDQTEKHHEAMASMPAFSLPGYRSDNGRFPLWSLAKKVNNGAFLPYTWQITGSCFPAGTMVRMAGGLEKAIETVEAGDVVVSHTGAERFVLSPTRRQYTGNMLGLWHNGKQSVEATADHQFLTADGNWIPLDQVHPYTKLVYKGGPAEVGCYNPVMRRVENEVVYCLKVEEDESFLANGWSVHNCFPAGTPVRMADGTEKAIETVQLGDRVVSHTGRNRQVVDTMHRRYTGDMYTVRLRGYPFPLTMTADHKMAVVRGDDLAWVPACELEEGDHLLLGWNREEAKPAVLDTAGLLQQSGEVVKLDDLMDGAEAPIAQPGPAVRQCRDSGLDWAGKVKLVGTRYAGAIRRFVPVCPSLARLVGLYLAKGTCKDHEVLFSFGSGEENLAQEVLSLVRGLFGVEGKTCLLNARKSTLQVQFFNSNLAAVFRALVPGNVYTKRVPAVFMHADDSTRLALIMGWLDGDGHAAVKKVRRGRKTSEVRIQGTTASAGLARDMTTVSLSCGMRAACSQRKSRGASRVAYDVYLSGKKAVSLYPALAAVRSTGLRYSDADSARNRFGYARPIVSVERRAVRNLPVFDFEVEEDHSFVAGGMVSSNCVGAGSDNMLKTLMCVEIHQGDLEEFLKIWWPYHYGQGRRRSGLSGRGEGSFGSGQAKALVQDGVFARIEAANLPDFRDADGWLQLSRAIELEWSDGRAKNVDPYKGLALKHPVKTAAPIKNVEAAKAALQNGYPLTIASMFGTKTIRPQGSPAVNIAAYDDQWPHQMFLDEWWDHPSLGGITRVGNNWGPRAHPAPTQEEPAGGFYITASTLSRILSEYYTECFAFSAFEGFKVRGIDWFI